MRSLRLLKKAISEMYQSLDADYKTFLNYPTKNDQRRKGGVPYAFPTLKVTIAIEWEDDENCLLSLKTPLVG